MKCIFTGEETTSYDIPTTVTNIMRLITTGFMLLVDLGLLQFSAESSYKALEALMTVYVFGLTNRYCTSIIAISSGVNIVRHIPRGV